MKRARFTEEQTIGFLPKHEAGTKCPEFCRKHGMSEGTFYAWKSKFGGMTVRPVPDIGHIAGKQRPGFAPVGPVVIQDLADPFCLGRPRPVAPGGIVVHPKWRIGHHQMRRYPMTRVLRVSLLAPDIVEAILDGKQGPAATLAHVLEPFQLEWGEQRGTWMRPS